VVRDMAWQLREHITKRRQKLSNSWSFWDSMWSCVPWVLPLDSPSLCFFWHSYLGLVY
jgi:hypothetical protein